MIKILEEGPKEFVAICPYCGTKFAYELSDLTKVYGTDVKKCNCPTCSQPVVHKVNTNNI